MGRKSGHNSISKADAAPARKAVAPQSGESSPHDQILGCIQRAIGETNEIRLLGRISGGPDLFTPKDSALLIIPDLHAFTPSKYPGFNGWHINYYDGGPKESRLADVLEAVAGLRQTWLAGSEPALDTYQIGDYWDIWREGVATDGPFAPAPDAHWCLRGVMYANAGTSSPCLDTHFVQGNHDTRGHATRLGQIADRMKLTYYLRGDASAAVGLLVHGDCFDQTERCPQAVKVSVVDTIGRLAPIKPSDLSQWETHSDKITAASFAFRASQGVVVHPLALTNVSARRLTDEGGAPRWTGAPRASAAGVLPGNFCQMIVRPEEAQHKFFQKAFDMYGQAKSRNESVPDLRLIVIGHTHSPCLIHLQKDDASRPFIFMDVGGWIEKCEYDLAEGGERPAEWNAQLGVIWGDDIRIYQIRYLSGA